MTTHREEAVVVEHVVKRYARPRSWKETVRRPFAPLTKVASVNGVSFRVHRGEFFGLLGPNGAGKTTLLRMLATFLTPDEGDIWVDGHHTMGGAAMVRNVVAPVMANERSLYWRLSARDNLHLFGALWGIEREVLKGRTEQVLSVVGLADTGEKLVGQFSSGMMQRLLIARALLAEPRVLLLDEPTRSLDPVSARDFRRFLREELVLRRECAVVLATHSADEAFELCDRVAIVSKGELVAEGVPAELAREYSHERYVVWAPPFDSEILARYRMPVETGAALTRSSYDGCVPVLLEIPGGSAAASDALRELVIAGVRVVAFERLPLSLADLIERAASAVRREG